MKKKKDPILYSGLYSAEEIEIIEAYERGEFKPAENEKELMEISKIAAKNYFKKNARINIRISNRDLMGIKQKAEEEGLPYQTLIASVLHKFVSGRLVPQNPQE